jgi:pimeloyl-ACP methyl ester carboxylesterase
MPGLDGTGKLFEPFIQQLPADIPVKTVCYPNDRTLSLHDYALIVSRCLPPGPVILLAESFSGLVALTLLAEHPKSVQGIIFCGAFAESPRPFLLRLSPLLKFAGPLMRAAPAYLFRQFCLGMTATAQQLVWLRCVLAEVQPAVLAHRLGMVSAHNSIRHGCYDLPCFYIQASADRLVPAQSAQWFSKQFKSYELITIEGPHFLLQARAQECAAQVTAIYRKIRDFNLDSSTQNDMRQVAG